MEPPTRTFDRTRDHWWWRPGWEPGTRFLTFHLTFEEAPELHAAAAATAEQLAGEAAVDLVPAEWLHLTMTGVGHAAEVDERAVESLCAEALSRSAAIAAEPLRLSSAFLNEEAFGLRAERAPWLVELARIQREAVRALSGDDGRDDDDDFHPHVSLAYFAGEADLARIDEAVRALPADVVVVRHPRLSLIEIGRESACTPGALSTS